MILDITLPIEPPMTTYQQKGTTFRNGKFCRYDRRGTDKSRAALVAALREHVPEKPLEGALALSVDWKFKPNKAHKSGEWFERRPDCDNLMKGLQDIMTALGFWQDDKQIVDLHVRKWWDDDYGLNITIEPLDKKGT